MSMQPQQVQPAKIPETVPLGKADEERQKLYGALSDPVDFKEGEATGDKPAEAPQPEDNVPEEDRRAFVRALLGDRPFEKVYKVFGQVQVKLLDRTALQTEALYSTMEADRDSGKIKAETPELWTLWVDRYRLAANLREIKQPGMGSKDYPETANLFDRIRGLLELPKPMFQAVLQANRDFEELVNAMTRRAQQSDFWPAGGSASPSRPTSPVPSTIKRPAPASA